MAVINVLLPAKELSYRSCCLIRFKVKRELFLRIRWGVEVASSWVSGVWASLQEITAVSGTGDQQQALQESHVAWLAPIPFAGTNHFAKKFVIEIWLKPREKSLLKAYYLNKIHHPTRDQNILTSGTVSCPFFFLTYLWLYNLSSRNAAIYEIQSIYQATL